MRVQGKPIFNSVRASLTRTIQTYLDVSVEDLDRKGHTFQWYPFDLWDWKGTEPLFLMSGVRLVTDSGLCTSGSPTSLTPCSPSDPLFHQPCQSGFGIECRLFYPPTVNDVDDVVDGDRRLSFFRVVSNMFVSNTGTTLLRPH